MKPAVGLALLLLGCGGGNSSPGGSLHAVILASAGSNVDPSPFEAVEVFGVVLDGDGVFNIGGDDHHSEPPPAPVPPGRLLLIDIKDSNGGTSPAAGKQYLLHAPDVSTPDSWKPGVAELTITERWPNSSTLTWTATAGTVTIESVVGDGATVSFSGTMMQGAQFSDSQGTFTLQGTCTIEKMGHAQHGLSSR